MGCQPLIKIVDCSRETDTLARVLSFVLVPRWVPVPEIIAAGHMVIHTRVGCGVQHPYIPTSLHPYIPTSLHPYIPTSLHLYIPTSLLWPNGRILRMLPSRTWAVKNGDLGFSALAEHVLSSNHRVALSKAMMINTHNYTQTRLLESWHI